MALSYDETQQLFEQMGFKGFSVRPYDAKMENLLSDEPEDNVKAYVIDIVPGGLEDGLNDGIALLEKHYYKKANMDKLYEKWLEIVLHFSCYYPLKSVFVTGLALPDDEKFMTKTPNEDGYYLEFPLESIEDLDMLSELVSPKTYSKSYKMKRRIENPEENRAIFLNVHEPIIDRVTWEKVQSLQTTRSRRPTVTKESSAFCGYLKCPECGGNLTFHFNQGNHDIKFFSCNNHNSGLRKCSSTHYIRLDFLEQVVLYEVHRLACFANEYENDFIKAMVGRSAKVAENDRVRKKRELDGLLARDRELDMLFERLYEDNVSGKIDDARFAKMSKRYEQEQGENAGRIEALRLELKKLEDKRMDVDAFLETVRRYTDATTITKRMVAELIQYIEVYPAVKEDGVTNQQVTIHYNCIGAFEVPDRRKIPERDILLETRKGVALSYAPAQIAI